MDADENARWLALGDILQNHTNLLEKIVALLVPPEDRAPSAAELLLQDVVERLIRIEELLDTRLPEPKRF